MLCRTHQPQWGSRDPRHSSHDVYCTQLSTGTRVTWRRSLDVSPRPPGPRSPRLGPFCLVPSRVTLVPPESGHTDLPLCRQQRAREMALSTRESASPSCPAAPRHSQGSHGSQSSARGQQAGQRAAAGSRPAGQKQRSKHVAWRSWPGQDQGPGAPDAPHPTQPLGLEASIRRLSPRVPSRSGRGSGRLVSPPAPGAPTCFSVMAYRYRRSGLITRSRRMGLPSWATTLS